MIMQPTWNHSGSPRLYTRSRYAGVILMRTYALAIAAAALSAFPASAFFQVPDMEIRAGGVGIGDDDEEGASQQECEELRQACLHKEELGESYQKDGLTQ